MKFIEKGRPVFLCFSWLLWSSCEMFIPALVTSLFPLKHHGIKTQHIYSKWKTDSRHPDYDVLREKLWHQGRIKYFNILNSVFSRKKIISGIKIL